MDGPRPLGLYFHIPFCRSKCVYCDFYSLPRAEGLMDAYCDVLCAQLRAASETLLPYEADTIYFGGGTPSLLGAARLCRLLDAARQSCAVSSNAEITFEANPESARDLRALRALRAAGFNRVSLGVQSLDDGMLRALGRVHTAAEAVQAVDALRRSGFDNLSLDLMYGLPGQTIDHWTDTLRSAADLAPEHLSCYGLKVEPGTPLARRTGGPPLPGDDEQADMYLAASDALRTRGYEHYEISNFARPGFASRHNMKYWTLGEYLGFGPGAASDFGGRRTACARDLTAFLRGDAPLAEDRPISPRERLSERVMLSLRTSRGIAASDFPLPFDRAEAFLRRCEAEGLAALGDGHWHLTPRGYLVSNAVILGVQEALGL